MLKKILIAVIALLIVGVFFIPQITWQSAKKAFEKENLSKPWAPKTAYNAGKINLRFMRYRQARMILEKTYTTWPKGEFRGDCHYQIGLCYEKTGKAESAVKWYESFRQKYPHHHWRDQAQKRIENLKANLL